MSARPRFRQDLVVRRLTSRNETYVIVKDPLTLSYYKFEPWEHDLFELMDGTRELEELTQCLTEAHPEVEVDLQWMADYVDTHRASGLLERSERERHLVMMDKLKTLRRRRFSHAKVVSVFQIQFKLFDPDRMMNRLMPWIRWLWSGWFVSLALCVFGFVLGFLISHWDLYWAGFFSLIDPSGKSLWDWVALFLLIFTISIWHELGHGLTCKRFGGEVHDIGFMIFYFEPAFYCTIDDSYLFPKLSHRIYCALGGVYFESMICATALAVWLLTPVEWWVHGLASMLVFVTGLSALFNLHPLIKLDGYYVLMDWLDMPDLRENSFEYVRNWVKKRVFHLEVGERPIPRRHRRIFLAYGVVAIVYTALVLLLVYSMFKRWMVGWFGPLGYLILFAAAVLLSRRALIDGTRFLRHLYLDKREWLQSNRGRVVGGLALLVVILSLTLPRSATRIEATFVVEPGRRAVVRAPSGAVVRDVLVEEGSEIEAGNVLAVLDSPELEAARSFVSADLERIAHEAARARRGSDVVLARQLGEQLGEAETRLEVLERKLQDLTLRSPIRGIVTTWDLERLLGRYLAEGQFFCSVDRLETVRLSVATPESDIESVRNGVEVRMRAAAYPGRTLRAKVRAVAPVARAPEWNEAQNLDLVQRVNLVRVVVEIDNSDGSLRPGMSGRVQFLGQARSPVGKAWWRFRRWAETVVW